MTTFPSRYACTADHLINAAEALDHRANVALVHRGQWMLPLLQLLSAGAVVLARRLERANR